MPGRGRARARAASRRTVSARAAATAIATSAVSCSIASSQCASGLGCSSSRLRERSARSSALTRLECVPSTASTRRSRKRRRSDAGPPNRPSIARRQPDDAQVIREGRGGSDRLAVDAAFARAASRPPTIAAARCRCRASRGPARPRVRPQTAHEPSPSANATSSSVARRRPRPGARNEIASIRLVLPAPFGPTSTASCASTRKRRGAIAAEIRERQAADACRAHRVPEAGVRRSVGFHKSLNAYEKCRGPRRQRIGTNRAASDFIHGSENMLMEAIVGAEQEMAKTLQENLTRQLHGFRRTSATSRPRKWNSGRLPSPASRLPVPDYDPGRRPRFRAT